MKKCNSGFTIIEFLVASVVIFTLILLSLGIVQKLAEGHTKDMNSLEIDTFKKEMFSELNNKNDLKITFYKYADLTTNKKTPYDIENRYRNDLVFLIEKGVSNYAKRDFKLVDGDACIGVYDMNLVADDTKFFYENLGLDICPSDISTPRFQENFNILSIVDKSNERVYVYLVFQNKLLRITSSLDNNFSRNNVINFQDIIVDSLSPTLHINKFIGSSGNKCGSTNTECTFSDYTSNDTFPGKVNIQVLKFVTDDTGIIFNTLSESDFLLTINN